MSRQEEYTLPLCPASALSSRSLINTFITYTSSLDAQKYLAFDRFFQMGHRMYLFRLVGDSIRALYPSLFIDDKQFFMNFPAVIERYYPLLPPQLRDNLDDTKRRVLHPPVTLAASAPPFSSDGCSASDALFRLLTDETFLHSVSKNKQTNILLVLARGLEYALWAESLISEHLKHGAAAASRWLTTGGGGGPAEDEEEHAWYENSLTFADRMDTAAKNLIEDFLKPDNPGTNYTTVAADRVPSPWSPLWVFLSNYADESMIRFVETKYPQWKIQLFIGKTIQNKTVGILPRRESETLFVLRAFNAFLACNRFPPPPGANIMMIAMPPPEQQPHADKKEEKEDEYKGGALVPYVPRPLGRRESSSSSKSEGDDSLLRQDSTMRVWLPVIQVYGFGVNSTLLHDSIKNILVEQGDSLQNRLAILLHRNDNVHGIMSVIIDGVLAAFASSFGRFFSLRRTAAMTFTVVNSMAMERLLLDAADHTLQGHSAALARPAIMALFPVFVVFTRSTMGAAHLWPQFEPRGLYLGLTTAAIEDKKK